MGSRVGIIRVIVLGAIAAGLILAPVVGRSQAAQQESGPQKLPEKQTPQASAAKPQPQNQQPQYSISVASNTVNLDVVVTDQAGDVITGLKKLNFKVFDSGQEQTVTNFTPTDAPITLVVLMEFSRIAYSFFYSTGTGNTAYWSYQFLNSLGPKDWVALITYDLKSTIRDDFTQNKQDVQDSLRHLYLPDFNESNTFDSLYETVDMLRDVKGKKSILLLATGFDTFSKHTLDQTYKRLRSTDVTIFCIGVAETYFTVHNQTVDYLQAKNELSSFARMTGGFAWFPRFDAELPDIAQSVTAFLRNQYTLGFQPGPGMQDGKYHKVKVEAVDDDGQPLMVANKKGKKQKVIVYVREGYMALAANAVQ
jgi:VWFA-related protein